MRKYASIPLLLLLALAIQLAACTAATTHTPAEQAPIDGQYTVEVTLSGGSGRASVESPAKLTIAGGAATAVIVWSSPHYEHMTVGNTTYYPLNTEGNSTFEIPVVLDEEMPVSALTSAMSNPHLIDYTLYFNSSTLIPIAEPQAGWQLESSLQLQYARNFRVDYYQGGYALITLADSSRFLVAPEGRPVPTDIEADITVLQQPINNIYLVATSAMCLFDALDSLGNIRLSGSKPEDWYIANARQAMEQGRILYAGKYSAPDYELIMTNNCGLAIESTMISHSPQVKEQLQEVGIPVLVDQSSYETHPLGRTEWIKLYAVLVGKEELAEKLFDEQAAHLNSVANQQNTGQTVAFFHISSADYVMARKSGDYVTKMIELAGGNYIFANLGDPNSAASTVNVEMEQFYATAKDADFIIYNSTVGGELSSLQELIEKNSLLTDFKAVQNGHVWCTSKNLFQETTQLGLMIADIHRMLTETGSGLTELNFMYKLE